MIGLVPRLGAVLALATTLHAIPAARAMDIAFLYVGNADDTALLGAQQGLAEANLQGRFLGQSYRLEIRAPGSPGSLAGFAAVLAAVDADAVRALAGSADGVPVFNLAARDDALRGTCLPNMLHVIPSDAMARDAVQQWHMKHPDAPVSAAAWHSDFQKYAARDLNKRYRAASGRPMDDHAWAGWAAVKMTSDTVARLNSAEPGAVLGFLRSELRFDGQKGAEMTFRESGQLRQPLLIIEGGNIAGEAPVRGVAGPDELDSLGMDTCNT